MTQEEKQLLLKDLCARLPYGVKIQTWYGEIITSDLNTFPYSTEEMDKEGMWDQLNNFKPYLRPMSSMTDEEEILFRCELPTIAKTDAQLVAMRMELFLKGHLDFNHLIEKGLALEAPEDMYKNE